jgi:hypothetical protein
VKPCECHNPGFCERYQCEMIGRPYELCSGKFPPERPTPKEEVRQAFLAALAEAASGPTFIRMGSNYSRDLLAWVAAWCPVVTPANRVARRAACDACPYRDRDADRCKHKDCGCFLYPTPLGDALSWATKECPDGRWPLPVVA